MFVFDSLSEELSLLERREVKRLVMASIENTSKAAQALRVAILSGELSAVETLAKARALDGAKDTESVQPAEMPDWKKPIAPGKDSNAGEQKPILQSELPIGQRRYSLEELSDPATYQDDPALAKIARDIGVSRFNDLFANKMGRGDAKRAMTSGQYPQLVADEIEKIISKQEVEFTENQKGIIAALALSIDGYSIEPNSTEIIIRGKFDEDLHSRIKRIGYWDGATYANRKVWVIPASKGGSLKTIFKNHLVAKDANEKARQAATEAEYAKAQEAEKSRRDARIEQQRKDAIAKSTRVKVEDGQYKVGDEINGKKISSFGSSWEEGGDTWVQVTDENSSAYGYQPGLDWYPKVKVSRPSVSYRYAYFEVD